MRCYGGYTLRDNFPLFSSCPSLISFECQALVKVSHLGFGLKQKQHSDCGSETIPELLAQDLNGF